LLLPHFLILAALTGPRNGRLFPLSESRFTIGSSADATISLNDRQLEGFHAYIELGEDGLYRLNDLETDAGTFLRVDDIGGDLRLELGDVLSLGIGKTELTFWGKMLDESKRGNKAGGRNGNGCCVLS